MRRTISVLIALALLLVCARAETYVINFEGGSLAVNEAGDARIAVGQYERLSALYDDDGALTGYAAGIQTELGFRYALLSPEGEELTGFLHTSVMQAGERFICAIGDSYRILSSVGAPSFEEYAALAYAGNDRFIALSGNINDEIADRLSVILPDGTVESPGISVMHGLGAYSEGLMPICDGSGMKFGYIDQTGDWAIAPEFVYAGDFESGYALVSTREGYGLIDREGNFVIDAVYDYMARGAGCVIAQQAGRLYAFAVDAESVRNTNESPLNGAYARVSGRHILLQSADALRVMDIAGALLFELPATASVVEAGEGFIVRDGDWAARSAYLADASGRAISEPYNTIQPLDGAGGMFAYGIIDEDTREMRFGLMRADGGIATEPQYRALAGLRAGLYFAQVDGAATLIDAAGAQIAAFPSPPGSL
ncbi:MAG: WG repeat-containing protein [Christensenellales bacterium]|jgi:hypothetical protein